MARRLNDTTRRAVVAGIAGSATALATAAAALALASAIGVDLPGFRFLLFFPAGALLTGAAAASGSYLVARQLHLRPDRALLIQMLAAAVIARSLTSAIEAQQWFVAGSLPADWPSYGRIGGLIFSDRAVGVGAGGTGFGKGLDAALDLIGVLAGAAAVHLALKRAPTCDHCDTYLRELARKCDRFANERDLAAYYTAEFEHPLDSPEFAATVGARHTIGGATKGDLELLTRVVGCPTCRRQAVIETVRVFNGFDWAPVEEWRRFVPVPVGTDVRRLYSRRRGTA